MNKWQVNIIIWHIIRVCQVDIIIWQVMADLCHHNKHCTSHLSFKALKGFLEFIGVFNFIFQNRKDVFFSITGLEQKLSRPIGFWNAVRYLQFKILRSRTQFAFQNLVFIFGGHLLVENHYHRENIVMCSSLVFSRALLKAESWL